MTPARFPGLALTLRRTPVRRGVALLLLLTFLVSPYGLLAAPISNRVPVFNADAGLINIQGNAQAIRDIALTAGKALTIERISTDVVSHGSLSQVQEAAPQIKAGTQLDLRSGQGTTLTGAQLTAGQALNVLAGQNLIVDAAARSDNWQDSGQSSDGRYRRQATYYSGSRLTSGGETTLAANNDLTVRGSTVHSGGNLTAQAGGNLDLLASVDQDRLSYQLGQPLNPGQTGAYAQHGDSVIGVGQ
ncbi:hemagglutinin repeat-containing protein [Propionivibrio sp.]|uniref:hemagglutinin repeat-containing protein n=1 Tax=Propionivibrio sp. TaxID=2212460 RepID=UPI00263861AB|nr:hemagglutinin repeat-containing protein [Propionivibrio sp.]